MTDGAAPIEPDGPLTALQPGSGRDLSANAGPSAGWFTVGPGVLRRGRPSRRGELVRSWRNLLVPVAGALTVTVIVLTFRGSSHAPTLRATIETGMTIGGLAIVSSLWSYWKRTRRLSDLLLAVALLTMALQDFEFLAAPAIAGAASSTLGTPAFLTGRLVLAILLAGSAFAIRRELAPRNRAALALLAVPIICVVTPLAMAVVEPDNDGWLRAGHGQPTGASAIALTAPAIALLLVAAAELVYRRHGERDDGAKTIVAGALILLAGSWLYSPLMPGLTTDSLSGGEYLRAGAYALILIVALRMRVLQNRMEQRDAAVRERRRLIGDLHDGMAQDLAFIAAYAEKLTRDLGPDHPMVVAARRALAFSREAIVDLAASDAPTASEALQALADELSTRHGVQVELQIEGEDLPAAEREAVVRIAREGIVNAVRHGDAKCIAVSLHAHGRALALTIADDGPGLNRDLGSHTQSGYGLRAMRQQAESIGGELRLRPASAGGLNVELTVR